MYLFYGPYRHDWCEAILRVESSINHSEIGRRTSATVRFMIDGMKSADTQEDLLAQVAGLVDAYSADERDIKLVDDAGRIHEWWQTRNSLTGNLVKRPPNSVGETGAERVVVYRYSILLEAQYVVEDVAATTVVGYSSGIQRRGTGGPKFELVPAKEGLWKKQITNKTSPCTLIQYGEVTGLKNYPRQAIPGPLFPDDLVAEGYQYEEVKATANQQVNFTIRYSYEFQKNAPFVI